MTLNGRTSDALVQARRAWQSHEACKAAPRCFGSVVQETLSLHAILQQAADVLTDGRGLSVTQRHRFQVMMSSCNTLLRDIETVLQKYKSLNFHTKRLWDQMGDTKTGVDELRSRLNVQVLILTTFMQTNQVVIERKLERLVDAVQQGKHEGFKSSVESLTQDHRQAWKAMRGPLTAVGVTVAVFEENSTFVIEYIRKANASGRFEQSTFDRTTSVPDISLQDHTHIPAQALQTSPAGPARRFSRFTKKSVSTAKPVSTQTMWDKSHKVLMLGISEAGKTTVLNQTRLLSSSPFHTGQSSDTGEYGDYREVWWETLVAMKAIYEAPTQMDGNTMFPLTVMDAFHAVWDEPIIRGITRQGLEIGLNGNLEYLYKNMERVADPRDRPSSEDILNIRVLTLGIAETTITRGREIYRIFDVPGERIGRRKWPHAYETAQNRCVTLVASLLGYCSGVERESAGPSANQLSETIAVADDLMGLEWFPETIFVLHLTKFDRFRKTMNNYPLRDYEPQFQFTSQDENYVAYGLAFIANKFVSLAKKHNRILQVHCMNATSPSSRECLRRSLDFISETVPRRPSGGSGLLVSCPHCHMNDLFSLTSFQVPSTYLPWCHRRDVNDSSSSENEQDDDEAPPEGESAPAYSVSVGEAWDGATLATTSDDPSLSDSWVVDWSGVHVEETTTVDLQE